MCSNIGADRPGFLGGRRGPQGAVGGRFIIYICKSLLCKGAASLYMQVIKGAAHYMQFT
jgi:hypothetical protein